MPKPTPKLKPAALPQASKVEVLMFDCEMNPTSVEAKAVSKRQHNQYYLKFDDAELLDPFVSQLAPDRYAAQFEFRAVSKEAYEAYAIYAKTKNPARYRVADSLCKGVV